MECQVRLYSFYVKRKTERLFEVLCLLGQWLFPLGKWFGESWDFRCKKSERVCFPWIDCNPLTPLSPITCTINVLSLYKNVFLSEDVLTGGAVLSLRGQRRKVLSGVCDFSQSSCTSQLMCRNLPTCHAEQIGRILKRGYENCKVLQCGTFLVLSPFKQCFSSLDWEMGNLKFT